MTIGPLVGLGSTPSLKPEMIEGPEFNEVLNVPQYHAALETLKPVISAVLTC